MDLSVEGPESRCDVFPKVQDWVKPSPLSTFSCKQIRDWVSSLILAYILGPSQVAGSLDRKADLGIESMTIRGPGSTRFVFVLDVINPA